MVQQHIGRTGRVGAGEMADDAVEAEDGLDRITLEPAIEKFARAAGEQGEQVALLGRIEAHQWPGACGQRRQPLQPAPRWGLQREAAHLVGQPLQTRIISGQGSGILRAEPRHLGLCLAGADLQIIAVQRQEIVEGAQHDPQAVIGQAHVVHHLRLQQRDGVAGGGIAEAGREFLRHAGPAHHAAGFADVHLQPRAGEIEGRHQTVVAAADDDRVISHRCQPCRWSHPIATAAASAMPGAGEQAGRPV